MRHQGIQVGRADSARALRGQRRFGEIWQAAALMVLFLALASSPAWSQAEAINATLRGRITDPNGNAVPQAAITATNTATHYTRTATTESDGYYVIPNLPLGTYTITIEKEGFSKMQHLGVLLQAGEEVLVDDELKIGAVTTTIEVTGGVPIVEPTRVNLGRTIGQRELENLPLTSRNPYNFILFQPGVSGHPNPELGIPRTVNTNGQMDRINYQMDGMVDTQSDRYGLRLFPISDVYVREVQTVSNSYAPEFGGTSGNIYNVVTNSGTNDLHGLFQYIRRSVDATARPILLNPTAPKPYLALSDYSANAGGPVVHDKLFLFGGYEHLNRSVPSPSTIDPNNAAAFGLPASLLATAPSVLHGQFLNLRTDWNISRQNQLFIRYNYFRNNFPFNTGVGGLNALDASSDFRDRAHVVGLQLVSSISPRLLNEFRFSWAYRDNLHFANAVTGAGPQVAISNVANFGGTINAGDHFRERVPNWNENVTFIRGTHTMKFGISMSAIQDLQRDVSFAEYMFPSIAAYLNAKSGANPLGYSTFLSRTDATGLSYSSLFWGFYVQDSWQARPSVLLIYGLRYDRYQGPDANPGAPVSFSQRFNTPNGDVAPRLGFAWRLGPKTVVRASTGLFFDAPPTNLWFNALNQDGTNRTRNTRLSSTSPGAPLFPQVVSLAQAQDVTTISPDYKNAYAVNASLQVTRELSSDDALTLGYIHTGGRHLSFLRNINLIGPTGTLADGRPIFSSAVSPATRLNPSFNNISLQDVGANSNYDAFVATYQHRFSRSFQVSASYTFSHTISDAPDVNSFEQNLPIEDATNRLRDRGNSGVNRPHAVTISAVLDPKVNVSQRVLRYLLNDNLFAILGNLSSGDPQNVTSTRVLNGDSTTGTVTRPLFIGRNTVRGPAIYQVDLRYTRTMVSFRERVRAQFLLETNNLFNHPNITLLKTAVNVDGDGAAILPTSFAPQSTVLEGRIVQFGLALRW